MGIEEIIGFALANKAVIATALFSVSELLSFIPSIKANGLFQLVFNFAAKYANNENKTL